MRITLLLLVCITISNAQEKPITHNDYDLWKKISDVQISDRGNLIVSTIMTSTERGDGYIEIYNVRKKQKFTFSNGYKPSITADENFVVFLRKPAFQILRTEKKKKKKKEQQSKDDLFIYDVKNNRIHDSIVRIKKYKIPEETEGWIVMEKYKELKSKDSLKNDTISKSKDGLQKKLPLSFEQEYALVYDLKTKASDTIHQIKDFKLPETGQAFLYTRKRKKEKAKDIGVYRYDIRTRDRVLIDSSAYRYDKLAIDKNGKQFAFIAAKDSTDLDSLRVELLYYKDKGLTKLVTIEGENLKENWELSKDNDLHFSENNNRLYFYSKPKREYNIDTTLLEEEIPQVDVWNWKDILIQPEQKAKHKELSKKAFVSYFNTDTQNFVHIQDKNIESLIFDTDKDQQFVLGSTQVPYGKDRSWLLPWFKDYYIIDTQTGLKRMGLQKKGMRPYLSPDGGYALYYDLEEKGWFSLELDTGTIVHLTKSLQVAFYNEEQDIPTLAYPYGFGGFDIDGNALVYDRFDIWKLSMSGKFNPINITRTGRKNKIEYRVENLNPKKRNNASYLGNELLISSFDKATKASGLYVLEKNNLIELIKPTEFLISGYKKAKNADILAFTKENFNTFGNLHFTDDGFKSTQQITDINTHQKSFKWGTAELFSWKAYDGKELEGIIYKPKDFDPSKKYPLITYFYEKRSDSYHEYYSPRPSASIVNPSYLTSNGYVMFVPDIIYDEGKPGPSAYNCIVSGVEALEKLGYVDSSRMGIQGQSWGGYQVAYLITVTDKFKAAMAGAPVSNMTSAYGGIRWKTGLSRAFQYESSQSRIGKTLWDGLDLYIENSPLFHVPKINTPLLMMHNDNDGAVPYYQGIEMFMAMRRLQKPTWLLVYNEEAHNLKKVKNKQDLSVRMMQFFDHYLKDTPAPKWMIDGVPRIDKGKDFGYGLENETKSEHNSIPSSNE